MLNMYGDILFDLVVGFVGGLGLVLGVNIGEDGVVFELIYGFVLKRVGQNLVNLIVIIFFGVMMLRYLGEFEVVDRVEKVVVKVIKEGKEVIYDFGGLIGIKEFVDVVICEMERI